MNSALKREISKELYRIEEATNELNVQLFGSFRLQEGEENQTVGYIQYDEDLDETDVTLTEKELSDYIKETSIGVLTYTFTPVRADNSVIHYYKVTYTLYVSGESFLNELEELAVLGYTQVDNTRFDIDGLASTVFMREEPVLL